MTAFHLPFLPPEALDDEPSIARAAERAIVLAKQGDTRGALGLALQARRHARSRDMERGELEALNAAAIVHLIRGDAMAAAATAIDARDLARRSGHRGLHGQAVVSLQISAFNLGCGENAFCELHACVGDAVERGDPSMEVRARTALGVVLGDRGRFDAAQQEFTRALHLARHHPNPTGPARITANLANLHRKRARAELAAGYEARALHDAADAIRVARRACALATEEGNLPVAIDALAIRGCAHELRGERAEARKLLRTSVALGRTARCRPAIVPVLCDLGRLCLAEGDVDCARTAFADALEIARELRPSRKIAEACAGLADVEARLGHVAEAQAWRERAALEAADFEIAGLQTRRQLA